jgi:hypothetical protein
MTSPISLASHPTRFWAEQVFPKLDECCVRRALAQAEKVHDFAVTRYAAKSARPARVGADQGDAPSRNGCSRAPTTPAV